MDFLSVDSVDALLELLYNYILDDTSTNNRELHNILKDEYRQVKDPGGICGYSFKKNDIMYQCKECSADETVVVCSSCFNESVHENHNVSYHMFQGTSGGSCDCGDPEAFKDISILKCPLHDSNITLTDADKTLLPDDCLTRLKEVLKANLEFINGVLLTHYKLPDINEKTEGTEITSWALVLMNDDVNSFDSVIGKMNARLPNCNNERATDIAVSVDSIGQAEIYCSEDLNLVQKIHSELIGDGLHAFVYASFELKKKKFAFVLLDFCIQFVKKFPHQIKEYLVSLLCEKRNDSKSYLESLFLNADVCLLWKAFRLKIKEFFTLFLDFALFREEACRILAENYDLLHDLHEKNTREPNLSMIFYSVQLFTVPSLVRELENRFRLTDIILDRLRKIPVPFMNKSKVYGMYFNDLRYIFISLKDDPDIISRYFDQFFMFISKFEHMLLIGKAVGVHRLFENPIWKDSFLFEFVLSPLILAFIEAVIGDMRTRLISLFLLAHYVSLTFERRFHNLSSPIDECALTFHFPLLRLFITLTEDIIRSQSVSELSELFSVLEACKYSKIIKGFEEIEQFQVFFICAMDLPLLLRVLDAEAKAGFWVRNGEELLTQLQIYNEARSRDFDFKLFDEVLFFQTCCITIGPKLWLRWILKRYDFESFSSLSGSLQESVELATFNRLESLLSLLISVITSRFPFVQKTELLERTIVRHSLIHFLALKSKPFSEIKSYFADRSEKSKYFSEDLLHSVADFKESKVSDDAGVYELKQEILFNEIDPFNSSYSLSDRKKILQKLKEMNTSDSSLSSFKFEPLELNGRPLKLNNLIHSQLFIRVLTVSIKAFSSISNNKEFISTHILTLIERSSLIETSSNYKDEQLFIINSTSGEEPLLSLIMKTFPKSPQLVRILHIYYDHRHLFMKNCSAALLNDLASVMASFCNEKDSNESSKDDLLKKKKKRAKERQLEIMNQFKEDQKEFIAMHTDLESEVSLNSEQIEQLSSFWDVPAEETCIFCKTHLISLKSGYGLLVALSGVSILSSKKKSYISSCGHFMHIECFDNFIDKSWNAPTDVKFFFLCPYCRGVGHTILPLAEHAKVVNPEACYQLERVTNFYHSITRQRHFDGHVDADNIFTLFSNNIEISTLSIINLLGNLSISNILLYSNNIRPGYSKVFRHLYHSALHLSAVLKTAFVDEVKSVGVHGLIQQLLFEKFPTCNSIFTSVVQDVFNRTREHYSLSIALSHGYSHDLGLIEFIEAHENVKIEIQKYLTNFLQNCFNLAFVLDAQIPSDDSCPVEYSQLCNLFGIIPQNFVADPAFTFSSELPDIPYSLSFHAFPERFNRFLEHTSTTICKKCTSVSNNPALCIICYEVICGYSHCCMESGHGEIFNHTTRVHGDSAMYFLARDFNILLFDKTLGGVYIAVPYVNEHGESETSKKGRGVNSKLSVDRLNELKRLWLTYSISNEVARRIESNMLGLISYWERF